MQRLTKETDSTAVPPATVCQMGKERVRGVFAVWSLPLHRSSITRKASLVARRSSHPKMASEIDHEERNQRLAGLDVDVQSLPGSEMARCEGSLWQSLHELSPAVDNVRSVRQQNDQQVEMERTSTDVFLFRSSSRIHATVSPAKAHFSKSE